MAWEKSNGGSGGSSNPSLDRIGIDTNDNITVDGEPVLSGQKESIGHLCFVQDSFGWKERYGQVWPELIPDYVKVDRITNLSASYWIGMNDGFYVQHRDEVPLDTDVIFIKLGSNDAGYRNTPIGSLGVLDSNTYIGAFQLFIHFLYDINPYMRIILATATLDEPEEQPYNDALEEVANYYGLPIFDVYRNMGRNPYNQDFYLQADGTHMATFPQVQEMMARRIGTFIKNNY
jgi:lysophospholipase L1-like esterase